MSKGARSRRTCRERQRPGRLLRELRATRKIGQLRIRLWFHGISVVLSSPGMQMKMLTLLSPLELLPSLPFFSYPSIAICTWWKREGANMGVPTHSGRCPGPRRWRVVELGEERVGVFHWVWGWFGGIISCYWSPWNMLQYSQSEEAGLVGHGSEVEERNPSEASLASYLDTSCSTPQTVPRSTSNDQ